RQPPGSTFWPQHYPSRPECPPHGLGVDTKVLANPSQGPSGSVEMDRGGDLLVRQFLLLATPSNTMSFEVSRHGVAVDVELSCQQSDRRTGQVSLHQLIRLRARQSILNLLGHIV